MEYDVNQEEAKQVSAPEVKKGQFPVDEATAEEETPEKTTGNSRNQSGGDRGRSGSRAGQRGWL